MKLEGQPCGSAIKFTHPHLPEKGCLDHPRTQCRSAGEGGSDQIMTAQCQDARTGGPLAG